MGSPTSVMIAWCLSESESSFTCLEGIRMCFTQSSNESHQPKSDEVRAWSLGLDRLLQSRCK
eukprot:05875.XXX_321484_321734_1 [CDS] Oithona nana genome sequencing.